MNILIINGSPKGDSSITLQTVNYLQKLFPDHTYDIIYAGQQIKSIEKDFLPSRKKLAKAELVIFCYPVYKYLVPSQMHRFIELMKESGLDFSSVYATQISTSRNFYDTIAHRFIADNCADMGFRYIRGLSQCMGDLLKENGRKEAVDFFRYCLWNISSGYYEDAVNPEPDASFTPVLATPAEESDSKESDIKNSDSTEPFHIALVADYDPEDTQSGLTAMISRFVNRFHGDCEIVNLKTIPFAGGCLGCMRCASGGNCVYEDGFDAFLRGHINSADAVIYAFTIKDHSMGYRFKLFDDRRFCDGHRPVMAGKPVGYLVDGDLRTEENLRTLMEARAEVDKTYLAGIVTDLRDPDTRIDQLVRSLVYILCNGFTQPQNFYGVGGHKVFRDMVYEMWWLMEEDYRFYEEHGLLDFPEQGPDPKAGMARLAAKGPGGPPQRNGKPDLNQNPPMSGKPPENKGFSPGCGKPPGNEAIPPGSGKPAGNEGFPPNPLLMMHKKVIDEA